MAREKAAPAKKKSTAARPQSVTAKKRTNPKTSPVAIEKATRSKASATNSKSAIAESKSKVAGDKARKPEASSKAIPKIGGHVSGGLKSAVRKAEEIGAETMQIFLGSPQMWKEPSHTVQDVRDFRKSVAEKELGPVFVHGNYLVNLASTNPEFLVKGITNLRANLFLSDQIGAQGLIFHPGSAGANTKIDAVKLVVKAMEVVLDDYEGDCKLVLEVCAGQGQTVGDTFEELAAILKAFGNDKRLAICWDTCHLYSAGYDVATAEGLKRTIDQFDKHVGFEWLVAIHANDSKTPLGSRRDRHENIGEGHIGEKAFGRMINDEHLRDKPWILEVPGFEKKGPDRANIDILRRLAGV